MNPHLRHPLIWGCLALSAASASAQFARVDLAPGSPRPVGRGGHAATWVGSPGEMLVYGGETETGGFLSDTWLFDPRAAGGPRWRTTPAVNPPPARVGGCMVYDPQRRRAYLFGGYSGGQTWRNDTHYFEYATGQWTRVQALNPPPARVWCGGAWDTGRDRFVVCGGNQGSTVYADTWEFDPNTDQWTQIPIQNSPDSVTTGVTYYDAAGQRVRRTGGTNASFRCVNTTWEYDPSVPTWNPVPTPGDVPERCDTAGAWDASRNRFVFVSGRNQRGGFNLIGDAVTVSGNQWSRYPYAMPPRYIPSCAYDPTGREVIAFGGFAFSGSASSETWAFPRASSHRYGRGCPGSNGTPSLEAAPGSAPRIGQTFRLDASNLPAQQSFKYAAIGFESERYSGILLPSQLAALVPQASGCELWVGPANNLGGLSLSAPNADTVPIAIPNDTNLNGLQFFVQLGVFDPGAPNGFLSTSNATSQHIGS